MTPTERIFELIKEHEVTAREVAQATGLAPSNFTEWKKGNNQPGYGAIVKLANFFSVSPEYIECKTDIRKPGEISAASSTTPYEDLPPEALEELEKYKELLRLKYGKKPD